MDTREKSLSLAGINGDRAEAIRHVLEGCSVRLSAYDIMVAVERQDPLLLRRHGKVEVIQEVLRRLEADGVVDRMRDGRNDLWGLLS